MSGATTSNWDEAAQQLGVKVRWLRDNLSRLPHHRYARSIRFEADDIQAIRDMHRVVPPGMGTEMEARRDLSSPVEMVKVGRARRSRSVSGVAS